MAGVLVRSWALDDTDRLWPVGGLLVAHTAYGVLRAVHTGPDRIALILLGVLTVALLALLRRRLRPQPPAAEADAAVGTGTTMPARPGRDRSGRPGHGGADRSRTSGGPRGCSGRP